MYRKQRLTPKLRKKQKIVVSTPQNLWYDTGNNPAQKGKTADMEKVEISGAALAPLLNAAAERRSPAGGTEMLVILNRMAASEVAVCKQTGILCAALQRVQECIGGGGIRRPFA